MKCIAIHGSDLKNVPQLVEQMHKSRASIFVDRLKWKLDRHADGGEYDEYDNLNPLYLIGLDSSGQHIASTRLLPMSGRTMIGDFFPNLRSEHGEVFAREYWESSRFFVLPKERATKAVTAGLMWAGCRLGLDSGVQAFVGLVEPHMVRVYKMTGWQPDVLSEGVIGEHRVFVCKWNVTEAVCSKLADLAEIPAESRFTSFYDPQDTFEVSREDFMFNLNAANERGAPSKTASQRQASVYCPSRIYDIDSSFSYKKAM